MYLSWLVRASRWVRNPPSMGRVKLVLAIIAFSAALFVIERYFGWPEALTLDPRGGRLMR